MPDRREVRVSLTLGSAASLGAYEAGAVSGLISAVRALRAESWPIRVDTMSGTSAGALVALVAARALVTGLDPVAVLYSAWVENASAARLRSRGRRSPMSHQRIRRLLLDALSAEPATPRVVQEQPVRLYVALTNLQGLRYHLRPPLSDQVMTLATWSDGDEVELRPDQELRELFEPAHRAPADLVIASASHPGAFSPHRLDRRAAVERYRRRGIHSPPADGWFADGGLVDARLLGHALAAAARLDVDPGRVLRIHVVVDPGQAVLPGRGSFTEFPAPSWLAGLARATSLPPSQSLYDDVARAADVNARLQRRDALVDMLSDGVSDQVAAALREQAAAPDTRAALAGALDEIGGLAGKRRAVVDLLSPRAVQDQGEPPLTQLLAGRSLGHFAGFLSRDLRRSDFALGFDSALAWLPGMLSRANVEDRLAERVLAEVDRRRSPRWGPPDRGGAAVTALRPRARLQLARFAGHVARVLTSGRSG